jgi:hypothetical protein
VVEECEEFHVRHTIIVRASFVQLLACPVCEDKKKKRVLTSAQSDRGFYHYRRAAVSAQLKSKVGLALAKAAALRITLNLDGAPITSRTHTHPSHSQTSRLLTSSLSLGVPVPRATQCM